MDSIWPWLRLPFYVGVGVVSLGSGALYYFQNEILYPRNLPPGTRTNVPRPAQFGIEDSEELSLTTPDGETLSAFLIKPPNKAQARPVTILSFHGNAGNIGHRLPIAKVLAHDLQCATLMLEYRGYGLSTGDPNEDGLRIDAQTGLDYIRNRKDLQGNKTIIYGQSIGGAVSIDLVAKNKATGDIRGLILENTFLSIAKMIPEVMPVARYLTPLCHQYWRSEQMLPEITDVPILFLSGLKDEIVPPSHMKQLFKLCRSPKVVWKEFPNGDHNSTVAEPGYFNHIDDYLRKELYGLYRPPVPNAAAKALQYAVKVIGVSLELAIQRPGSDTVHSTTLLLAHPLSP